MRYLPRVVGWLTLLLLALPALLASMFGMPAYGQGTTALPGQVEITDTIQISQQQQGQSFIQIQLINCPTQHPRVILNAALSSTLVQTNSMPFFPDSNGNVVGFLYPNDVLNCGGTVGHSAYSVTFVQNGVPAGQPEQFIIPSSINPFDLSANIPVTQLPPPFVTGQDFHFRNLTLDDTLIANEVIANKLVIGGSGSTGTFALAWTTGGQTGTNVDPTLGIVTTPPSGTVNCSLPSQFGNMLEQTNSTGPHMWFCTASGWTQDPANTSTVAGVTSINGHTGAFTFDGPGVTCSGTSCTFSGTGTGTGGGSLNAAGAITPGHCAQWQDSTHLIDSTLPCNNITPSAQAEFAIYAGTGNGFILAGDPFLSDFAATNTNGTGFLQYTGPQGSQFISTNGGNYTFSTTDTNSPRGLGEFNFSSTITQTAGAPNAGGISLSTKDSAGNHQAANINISAEETGVPGSGSPQFFSGNINVSASAPITVEDSGNITMETLGLGTSTSDNITLLTSGAGPGSPLVGGDNIFLATGLPSANNPGAGIPVPGVPGESIYLTPAPDLGAGGGWIYFSGENLFTDTSENLHVAGDFRAHGNLQSDNLKPSAGSCVTIDQNGVLIPTNSPCGSGSGSGGGSSTNFVFNAIVSSASPNNPKICFIGSSQCSGGVGSDPPLGTPTAAFGLNTPSANTGTANAVAHYHFQDANPSPVFTQVLWTGSESTTAGSAIFFLHDFWMKFTQTGVGTTNEEFDTFLAQSSILYMFGTQCSGANGNVIQYDNENNGWISTNISCSLLLDGNYHHIVATYHRDAATSTSCSGMPCQHWDTIQFDGGTVNPINTTLPATPTNFSNLLDAQYQIDGDPTKGADGVNPVSSSNPDTYDLFIDTDHLEAATNPIVAGTGTTGSSSVSETVGDLGEFDFDSTTPTAGLTPTGTPTLDTATAFTTPNAIRFNAANEFETATITPSGSTVFIRAYMQINSSTTASERLFDVFGSGGATELFTLFLNGNNQFIAGNVVATSVQQTCSTAPYPTGSYHFIEVQWTPTAYTVKIDGNPTNCTAVANTASVNPTTVRFGNTGPSTPAWDISMDNVGFSDTGFLGQVIPGTGGAGVSGGSTGSGMIFPPIGIPVSLGQAWGTSLTPPQSTIVGVSDTQSLSNKSVDGASSQAISFVQNLTSDAQAQFNSKAPAGTLTGSAGTLVCVDGTGKVTTTGCPAGTGTGGATTVETNGLANPTQTAVNFSTSSANLAGLTITPSNPSGTIEKFEITGAPIADWTLFAELDHFNGDFYVNALSPASCTVGGTAFTTAFDCALANAKAAVATGGQGNATLHVGINGVLLTNLGIQEPTAVNNHGTVNIEGSGTGTTVRLNTSLASGVCMFTQPPEATAFNFANITVSNLTLDANNNADCVMSINGVSRGSIEHILGVNARAGAGHIGFQFGPSNASTSTVFETFVNDVVMGGLGGGYTPAIITCTVSSGNPVCTVVDGGSYPSGTFTVQVHGVGNGSGACSVYPTWTVTGTTSVTGLTATGGTCVAPLFVSVTPGARLDYDFLFGGGYTDSTVKDIRAIEETVFAGIRVLGHPNTFDHPHCYVGQFVCVEETGGGTFVGLESDSIGGYAAAIEGTGSVYISTTQIYNNFQRYAGSSLFYVDQGAATNISATVMGVGCNGNRQNQGGYHQLVVGTGLPYANTSTAGGSFEAGFAIPAGVQMDNVLDCSSSPSVNTVFSHIGTYTLPGLKATTGTRFLCVDTNGKLISQTTACSGT